jgi:hypothetical protein
VLGLSTVRAEVSRQVIRYVGVTRSAERCTAPHLLSCDMTPSVGISPHGKKELRSDDLRDLATFQDNSGRAVSVKATARDMAAASGPNLALAARSESGSLSAGKIAGAVVGSVLGAVLLLLVGGFVFFRCRVRTRRAQDDLLSTKALETHRRIALPGRRFASGRSGRPSGERYTPVRDRADSTIRSNGFYDPDSSRQQDVERGLGSSTFPYQGAGIPDGQDTTSPVEHAVTAPAAAASYYDLNISMDSDPDEPPLQPPTKQMTEMYQEQLRQSREKRRTTKASKGSTISRLYNSIKRKRSSRSSGHASAVASVRGSVIGHDPDVVVVSIEGQGGERAAPREEARRRSELEAITGENAFFQEPQEMSDKSEPDFHKDKRSKRQVPSQDSLGVNPHRLDSLQTALNERPPYDPKLPSSALGPSTSSTDVLRADGRRPTSSTRPSDSRARLKSPDIPEPMDAEATETIGAPHDTGRSALRSSHSPPLDQETFNPMMFMKPTTDMEKAAYVNAELDRIEKSASASPPSLAQSPPTYADDAADDEDEDDDMEYDDADTDDDVDTMLAPPTGVTHFDGPSDSSTTPAGRTSTEPSSIRTPDTRVTVSPSANSGSPSTISAPASPRPGYSCEECGRSFDQIHKLNHHKRYHDRKHVCTYDGCDRKFGTKTHLARHINDKHEKKKGFHCPEASCPYYKGGKAFPRKDNWRRHMQNKHGITNQLDLDAVDEMTA